MTPLDYFNALLFSASSLYSFIFSLGVILFVLLAPIIFLGTLARVWLWPRVCAFGNWLGRP